MPIQVARDLRGRYWVLVSGQLPLIFGPRGEFLGEIGRRGEGPGEFRGVASVAPLPGDSVLLVDPRLRRASVLGPDLLFGRAISLPVQAGQVAVLRWPDRVVVNGAAFASGSAGWPLHLLNLNAPLAAVIGSFGDDRVELRGGQTPALLRKFFDVGAAAFWSLHVVRYRLTQYAADGRVLRSLQRHARFFPDESAWSIGTPTTPPPPFLETAVIRRDTLWVAMRVARPDWKESWTQVRLPRGSEVAASRAPERTDLYMTRVEVIDLRRNSLITYRTLPGIVLRLDPDLSATVYDLDEDQVPRLRVLQLGMTR